jgi:hypothetical protein
MYNPYIALTKYQTGDPFDKIFDLLVGEINNRRNAV